MRYLLILVILLTIISCRSRKEITETETSQSVEEPKEIMGEPIIVLAKGACFGSCPVYTLSISETGDMIFDGKRNVNKLGKYSKKLDLNSLQDLVNTFEEYKFMELDDFYEGKIADTPSISITYTNADTTKTIIGKSERPARVIRLQKQIEKLAESSDGWTLIEASENAIPEEELIKSQIIIATKGGPTLAKWFDKMRVNHGIRIVKRLSAANNTWLISYNTKEYVPEEMLGLLRKNDFILSAEFNAKTQHR